MSIPHWNCETYRDLSYLTVHRVLFCVNKINNFMGLITFPIFTKLEKNSKSVYYSIQLWYIHDPLDMNLMTVQVLLNSQEAWSNIKFLRLMFITECMKHTKSKFLNIRVGRSDGEFLVLTRDLFSKYTVITEFHLAAVSAIMLLLQWQMWSSPWRQ